MIRRQEAASPVLAVCEAFYRNPFAAAMVDLEHLNWGYHHATHHAHP